jgi:hypothetical protein
MNQQTKQEPTERLNQYELVLAMTKYIRQNPDSPFTLRLKQCKGQAEQFAIFESLPN